MCVRACNWFRCRSSAAVPDVLCNRISCELYEMWLTHLIAQRMRVCVYTLVLGVQAPNTCTRSRIQIIHLAINFTHRKCPKLNYATQCSQRTSNNMYFTPHCDVLIYMFRDSITINNRAQLWRHQLMNYSCEYPPRTWNLCSRTLHVMPAISIMHSYSILLLHCFAGEGACYFAAVQITLDRNK